MKIIYALIVLILVGTWGTNVYAAKDTTITFSGSLKGFEKFERYYVYVNFNKYDWFWNAGGTTLLTQQCDSTGSFKFILPSLNKPYKINLLIREIDGTKIMDGSYFVGDGDDVSIYVSQNSPTEPTFTGQGSEKFIAITELKRQFGQYYRNLNALNIDNSIVSDSIELNSNMEQIAALLGKYQKKKQSYLQTLKIDTDMASILNYEFAGYMEEWTWRTTLFYRNNIRYRNQIARNYFRHSPVFFDAPKDVSVLCNAFITQITLKEALEAKMSTMSDNIELPVFYDHIKEAYSGLVRDRIIGACFFSRTVMRNFSNASPIILDSLLKDALSTINIGYVRKGITEKIDLLSKTNDRIVLNADFKGLNDKTVSMDQLKGKVVLIDTWFKGCFGCASFYKALKEEITPGLGTQSDFIILSVNIDKDNLAWKSGMSSGLYTSEEHINVTTGNGLNHPFLTHYNVKGSPWIMLINRDGIIRYQPDRTSVLELKNKILEVLAEDKISSRSNSN